MAEEADGPAGMGSADSALVAFSTRNRRFHGDPVAGFEAFDGGPDGFDDGGAFMADDRGIGDLLAPDLIGDKIMKVAAA
jgi:hypothetical protein